MTYFGRDPHRRSRARRRRHSLRDVAEPLNDGEETPAVVVQTTTAQTAAVEETKTVTGYGLADGCPPNWPGPWTACEEARWVRQVAERAGYRIVGETGSALIARGGGQSFYIWAIGEIRGSRVTPVLGTVAGVRVYGDESLRRSWAAQGFVFWLEAGPYGDSRLPTLAEMDSLVRASLELPATRIAAAGASAART